VYENMQIIKAPKIRGIVIEGDDVTFYFDDSDEAFNVSEFVAGTTTHEALSGIESAILSYNESVKG